MLRKILVLAWRELYATYSDRNLILIMIATPLALATIIGTAFNGFLSGGSAPMVSARAAALDLLDAVLRQRRPLDEALATHDDLAQLSQRDRQFVRALVTTTLRHLGQIDHSLAQCLEKPLPARAIAIRNILRLGVAQSLFLQTPAHAAVDTMVSLVAKRGGEAGYKGLVNAVLRRISREADLFRQARPGNISRNTWITEAVEEKLARERTLSNSEKAADRHA